MESPRAAPAGCAIFAVGDVHGQADELHALHSAIRREITSSSDRLSHVVHLGDYIDRGPDSRRVLEILSRGIGVRAHEVFLVGNHDQFLIELLRLDPELDRFFMMNWYENGGVETMKNLKVSGYGYLVDQGNLSELRVRVANALGKALVDFLSSLKPIHRIGDYVFVHAGIDPTRTIEDQNFADLLLIREPFLSADSWRHPFCVVHGHSIAAPAIHSHRIGVDAGCCVTGALCALQLVDDRARFVAATRDESSLWLERLGAPAKSWRWSTPRPI